MSKLTAISMLCMLLPLGARAQGALGTFGFTSGGSVTSGSFSSLQSFAASGSQANIGLQPGVQARKVIKTSIASLPLSGVIIYPNPTTENLSIQVEEVVWVGASVEIIDANGKLIYTSPLLLGPNVLDLQSIAVGAYALRLRRINGAYSVATTIIKQ